MILEKAGVIEQRVFQGDYRLLVLSVPQLAPNVKPGQFVHIQVSGRKDLILRRPFSVFKIEGDRLSVLFKTVGQGTEAIAALCAGDTVSIMGPLGNGFPLELEPECMPVLVAGGYGMAALYLLAERLPRSGRAFFGGRTKEDILCVDAFQKLGWDVTVATEDGSLGTHGLVTDAMQDLVRQSKESSKIELYACGPYGMLKAVAGLADEHSWTAWTSLDRKMGCGVGACLTCVQRLRGKDGQWTWGRVCKDGPVFRSTDVLWDDEENA